MARVGRDLRDAATILARHPLLVVYGLVASVAAPSALCVVPLLIAAHVLGRAVHAATAGIRPSGRAMLWAGAPMLAVVGGPALATLVGLVTARSATEDATLAALAAAAGAFALGIVVAPFATVADHLVRRASGLSGAIGRALAAGALLGRRVVLARGVTLGALALVPALLFLAGDVLDRTELRLASLAAVPLAVALGVALGAVWGAHDERALGDAQPVAVSPALWAPIAAAALALVGAATIAAMTPSPAFERLAPVGVEGCVPELHDVGPHRLTITMTMRAREEWPGSVEVADGFDVRTADGGGAGVVTAAHPLGLPLLPHEICRAEGGYLLRFAALEIGADALVDEAGVRIDDGLSERLRARSYSGPWLVALSLGALWILSVVAHRRLRPLAGLAGIDAKDALHVVPGRLERGEGARIATGVNATIEGEVTFVSSAGDLRLRLPQRATLLGPDGELPPNELVRLCVPSAPATMGLRTGTQAWPEGAILLIGEAEPARAALLSGITRASAPWIVVATVALALAALELLVRL